MTTEHFEAIKKEHGKYASWAIWAAPIAGESGKSNVSDLSVFNMENWKNLEEKLKENIVMVGLNPSGEKPTEEELQKIPDFSNFHNTAKDRKLRDTFIDTEFEGAYMTDLGKFLFESDSNEAKNKLDETKCIQAFEKEIGDLNCKNECIIAFGGVVYDMLRKNGLCRKYKVIQIPHFSARSYNHFEDYKGVVDKILLI